MKKYVVCTHWNCLNEAILMSTFNIYSTYHYFTEDRKDIPKLSSFPPDPALRLTLSSSNYLCLEQISRISKMFEPLEFDYSLDWPWETRNVLEIHLQHFFYFRFRLTIGTDNLFESVFCHLRYFNIRKIRKQRSTLKYFLNWDITVTGCGGDELIPLNNTSSKTNKQKKR